MTAANTMNPSDYDQLKQLGLEYIQKFGHKHWTDYNVHDPGVTFLEALCFSLTDLAYRTSFPMKDLLTPEGESHPRLDGSLFPAHEILSFNPVTEADYQKFILENVPGIKHIQLEPQNRTIYNQTKRQSVSVGGTYRVDLILDSNCRSNENRSIVGNISKGKYADDFSQHYEYYYKHYTKNMLLKHRNLCEDFGEIRILKPIPVGICVEIQLESQVLSHQDMRNLEILQKIYDTLDEYISPNIYYHSMAELLEKGKSPEEIYQGVLPRWGFIDPEELSRHKPKKELFTSDIASMLLKIDGIKSIRHLHFKVPASYSPCVELSDSHLVLKSDVHCLQCCDTFRFADDSDILGTSNDIESLGIANSVIFIKDWFPFYPEATEIVTDRHSRIRLSGQSHELPLPESRNRNLRKYFSFQQLLPECYKMGKNYEGAVLPDAQQAEKRQLKAYLCFFDQLLADYLVQLDSLQEYFSIKAADSDEVRSYFLARLSKDEIADVEELLANDEPYEVENRQEALYRRNRLMDHLLARFNDSFADYAALQFMKSNGKQETWDDLQENIEDKKRYLQAYPEISGNRAQAIDYTENMITNRRQKTPTLPISGIEQRISRRLGINAPLHRLATTAHKKEGYPFEKCFGLHVLEHLLLLPPDALSEETFLQLTRSDTDPELLTDPYSFRVTVVYPSWTDCSRNMYFRQYVENIVREEIPAHIVVKHCWINQDTMTALEDCYAKLLGTLNQFTYPTYTSEWKSELESRVKDIIQVFHQLKNVYHHTESYLDHVPDQHHEGQALRLDNSNIETDEQIN